MPFKRNPQKFSAAVTPVTIGTGERAVTLGGENVMPLYTFDAPIENRPRIGVEIAEPGFEKAMPGLADYYAGAETIADLAKKAAAMPGADFIAINLECADPNGEDRSVDECVEMCKAAADAVDVPIAVIGCKNHDKDAKLFEKISDALQGKNILVMSACEENYKTVAASAGLAYGQKVGAESSVDINLAKQLNVLISQMGLSTDNVVMNVGSAAAGYGFEYVASTMDRVRGAALSQNDAMLQSPIITPVADDAWNVKEAMISEEDMPEWGPTERRGVTMEIATAAACLASGSNAVILRHPESVAAVSKFIGELM